MSSPSAASPSSSSAAALSTHESFQHLLEDPLGRQALLQFLESRYSEHHLRFWEEIHCRYRLLSSDSARAERAQELYQAYIKNGSVSQINITEPQRVRLQEAVEKMMEGDLSAAPCDLFDDSASTCSELIKGNYFYPFQSSPQCQQWKKDRKQRDEEEAIKAKKSATCVIL